LSLADQRSALMEHQARIFVAGHRGMVGSAIVRRLLAGGFENIVTRTHAELDLLDQGAVNAFLETERLDYIFIAAAKVGGIQANNQFRADFIYQNLMIEANLIHGAHVHGVQRLMLLGSSCIYPRDCPQPIREDYLLTGPLEPTNEPYAIAKIAGIKLCESYNRQYGRQYVCAMPTNLYGPNDNYDLATSHVLPALIRKAHEGRARGDSEYAVWGSGIPDGARLRRPARQHRHRRRRDHPRTGRNRDASGRLRWSHRVRQQQARRHAAKAARCEPARRTWLACAHRAARRHLAVVCRLCTQGEPRWLIQHV
jgi:hypothetical protein